MGRWAPPPGLDGRARLPTRVRDGLLALAGVIALGIYVRHVADYFFLFDDYALVHEASSRPAAEILQAALFGFYRPAAFLLTKAEFAVAGWSLPALYAGTNLAIHLLNAGLVYVLARQLTAPRHWSGSIGPVLATLIFGLSPWAIEGPFWMSARFDVLAAFGVLVALVCGAVYCQTVRPGVRWLAAAAGCAGAVIGILAKEMAATVPLLFAMLALTLGTDGERAWQWRRALAFTAALVGVVVAYVWVREQILPGLNGAYGSWPDLLRQASLADNLRKFTTGLFRFAESAPPLMRRGAVVLLVMASASALAGLLGRPRIAALCLAGFLTSLIPVWWAGLAPTGSGAGRFLYLPGIWFAVMLGLGLGREATGPRLAVSNAALAAVTVILMTSNLWWQSRVWASAADLARTSILQLGPYANTERPIFIPNLPFWYEEGAYVLKDYAFSFYYGESKLPPIRVRPFSLKYAGGVSRFSAWADQYGAARAAPDERIVPLHLAVQGVDLPPLTPVGLRAVVAGDVVKLSWKLPSGSSAATRIVIEGGVRPEVMQVAYEAPGDATTYAVGNVPPNTYYVKVRAANAAGLSADSPAILITVPSQSQ